MVINGKKKKDYKNLKSLLGDLEKLEEISNKHDMYSKEPDYTLTPKIERIYGSIGDNPVFERVYENYEDFETLYDLLDEYISDRYDYDDAYSAFENRENDPDWFDNYDGFEYDDGPHEIEYSSDEIEETLEGSLYDISNLLEQLELSNKLKLPEDIIRTFIKPAIF